MIIKTRKKYVYQAFGLDIQSEIPFNELTLNVESREPELFIILEDLTKLWMQQETQPGKFSVGKDMVMFQIPNTATFCIKEGKWIIVSPMENAEFDKIHLYVLGTCLGILLMQKRVMTLHGSAIAINGKAYAIIGDSGAGKSTLARAFLEQGNKLLSDDLIPLEISDSGIPHVHPSYPQQKLWQESLQEFGMETTKYRPLFDRETKYAIPTNSSFLNEALPLAGVFELVKTENKDIVLNPIESLERFRTIYNHTFRHSLIPRLGLTEWHFRESVKLLKQVDLYQLQNLIQFLPQMS